MNHLTVCETHTVFSSLSPPHVIHFLFLVSNPPGWGVSEAGFCPLGRRLLLCRRLALVLRRGENPRWLFPWWLPPWQQVAGVGITLGPWLGGDLGQRVLLYIMDWSVASEECGSLLSISNGY